MDARPRPSVVTLYASMHESLHQPAALAHTFGPHPQLLYKRLRDVDAHLSSNLGGAERDTYVEANTAKFMLVQPVVVGQTCLVRATWLDAW